MSVQSRRSVCTVPAQRLLERSACTVTVQWLRTVCAMSVHSVCAVSAQCPYSVLCRASTIFAQWQNSVCTMCVQCVNSVCKVFIQCQHSVSTISLQCPYSVCTMSAVPVQCLYSVCLASARFRDLSEKNQTQWMLLVDLAKQMTKQNWILQQANDKANPKFKGGFHVLLLWCGSPRSTQNREGTPYKN